MQQSSATPVFGTVSSLHPTSFLMIFTLVQSGEREGEGEKEGEREGGGREGEREARKRLSYGEGEEEENIYTCSGVPPAVML